MRQPQDSTPNNSRLRDALILITFLGVLTLGCEELYQRGYTKGVQDGATAVMRQFRQ